MLNYRTAEARAAKPHVLADDISAGRTGTPEWYGLDQADEAEAKQAYHEALLKAYLRKHRRG